MKSKFTERARNTISRALVIARENGSSYIGSEHLLIALSAERECAAAKLLYARGIDDQRLRSALSEAPQHPYGEILLGGDMTPKLKRIIESAALLSAKYGHGYVGTEHLLLAILGEKECAAVNLIEEAGGTCAELRADITAFLDSSTAASSRAGAQKTGGKAEIEGAPTVSKHGRNLTAMASEGLLDPITGRERETERVMQILCRRSKNNPCLIGEPGVGKTAVVEGLARRIADGSVPDLLEGKTIITLDIPSMIAGAKYRGEFEERMKAVMDEAAKNPDLILFIDEIHTIIGAGAAEGAVDAANILKPALARGEIQIIGATTIEEYRRHIEKDAALERRFQPVSVTEPSPEEAADILFCLRDKYEAHHKLRISDGAIEAAVSLSVRYITDRFLPDKAIDLIDEAAAGKRIETGVKTAPQKEAESRLADVIGAKEEAIASQDFERAAELRDEEIRLREKCLEYEQIRGICGTDAGTAENCPEPLISAEDIARVVTMWTGIPVSELTENDGKRLAGMAERLKSRIIGQDKAIDTVCAAIARGRTGLKAPSRPIGSFLFCGSSGVGKTELCRILAEDMFGTQNALIRLDMSEYMEKHSVSRLIGSPPGYIGYGEGGQLTEPVRRRPYSVVLFDEIEKAHPDIFNILLQVLEDGTLTDSQGRKVDFRNTVIILTSNIGTQYGSSKSAIGFSDTPEEESVGSDNETQKHVFRALKEIFRPEFLDRIDETVIFRRLDKNDLSHICLGLLNELSSRAASRGISVSFSPSAVDFITVKAASNNTGARALRRSVTVLAEDRIASMMTSGEITAGAEIMVNASADGSGLEFAVSAGV